jgi:hypothetical protein
MGEGYQVDPEQLRNLASRLSAFSEEFDALITASQAISQDDEAYGLLCSWMPAILEGRHQEFDEWVNFGQENMELLSQALAGTADDYEAADEANAKAFDNLGEGLGS